MRQVVVLKPSHTKDDNKEIIKRLSNYLANTIVSFIINHYDATVAGTYFDLMCNAHKPFYCLYTMMMWQRDRAHFGNESMARISSVSSYVSGLSNTEKVFLKS